MNRRYSIEEFKNIVELLKKNYEDVNLTTDIIVGFPGETEEEFQKTYEFLKEIKFYKMHIFKYSPRKGTPASEMENQIDPQVKQLRSDRLLNLDRENFRNFANKYLEKEVEVLFEKGIDDTTYEGLTPNYIRVVVKSNNDIQGKILKTKIIKINDDYTEGVLI